MSQLYKNIEDLCKNHNINITKLCNDAKISRTTLSELNKGRTKELSLTTLNKIASYFNVQIEDLQGIEKAPPTNEVVEEANELYDRYVKFTPEQQAMVDSLFAEFEKTRKNP